MKIIYKDVIASLGKIPEEQRFYIFGESEEDIKCVIAVANYIILEYIKYSFDYEDPEYPIRHFIGKDAEDDERMLQSRIAKYVMKYKKEEILRNNITLPPNHKFSNIDMNSIEQKLKGYHLTEMNYFEHQNVHDMEIIKAIVEKRIGSAKKISNEKFQEIFEQYDMQIEKLNKRSKMSDEDMIFSSLAFFTLEWKYSLELIYALSVFMEEESIDENEIDINALILLSGNVSIESKFGGTFRTDSRMVKERLSMLIPLFGSGIDPFVREYVENLYKEIIVLGVKYKEVIPSTTGESYKEWFRKNATLEDMASFLKYYDIFSCWHKKEWTRKRISIMRKLIDKMTV